MTRILTLAAGIALLTACADNMGCMGTTCPRSVYGQQQDPLRQTASGVSTINQIVNGLSSMARTVTRH